MTPRPGRAPRATLQRILAAGCALAAGCGGAPAAPVAPAAAAPSASAPAPPPPPDLSRVPDPPGLVISGRLAKLGASFGVLHGWTGLTLPQSAEVGEAIAGSPLGPIVDLDQPIDFAVAAVGQGTGMSGLVAVSAAVRDAEAAKAALAERYRLAPGAGGVTLLEPSSPQPDGGSDDARHPCELAPAYGAAPTRLVCGTDGASLAALAPWLARTATRAAAASDAHVEVRLAPLKEVIRDQWRTLSALFGATLGSSGPSPLRGLALQWLSDLGAFALDLDRVAIDVDLADSGATATTTIDLAGTSSTIGRALVGNADRSGPPPDAFWRMPADADVALFARGFDANDFARWRDLILRAAADALAGAGIGERDRHAIVDAFGDLMAPAAGVYASGVDEGAAARAIAARRALGEGATAAAKIEANRAVAEAIVGWHVVESDEPAAGDVDALKALAAALARPGVKSALGARSKVSIALRAAPVPAKIALPAGTQHFVLELTRRAAAPASGAAKDAKAFLIHLFVVPDGARSWAGFGADAALTASKLAAAVGGTGAGLGSLDELAALKDARVGAAGMMRGRLLPEVFAEAASLFEDDPTGADDAFGAIGQTPNKGATPVLSSLTPRPGQSSSAVATVHVPRGAIEDVVAAALRYGHF